MKRVSSRQRLVSWGTFDAAANDSDTESNCSSDYETCYEFSNMNEGQCSLHSSTVSAVSLEQSVFYDDNAYDQYEEDCWTFPEVHENAREASKKRDRSSMKDLSGGNPTATGIFPPPRLQSSSPSAMKKSVSFSQISHFITSDMSESSEHCVVNPKVGTSNNTNYDSGRGKSPKKLAPGDSYPEYEIPCPRSELDTSLTSAVILNPLSEDPPTNGHIDVMEPNPIDHEKAHGDEFGFCEIIDDTKLYIFTYLNPSEIRAMSATNRQNFVTCHNEYLWLEICSKEWPFLGRLRHQNDIESATQNYDLTFRDDSSTPIMPPSGSLRRSFRSFCRCPKEREDLDDNVLNDHSSRINFSVLHGLSQPYPTGIDEQYFSVVCEEKKEPRENENNKEFRSFEMTASTKCCPESRMVSVLQFTDAVGTGDRSICSSQAFPHVHSSNSTRWSVMSLFELLLRGEGFFASSASSSTGSLHGLLSRGRTLFGITTIKPFVSPIVSKVKRAEEHEGGIGETLKVELNVTPRLVAYYEISVLELDKEHEPSEIIASNDTSPRVIDWNRFRQEHDDTELPASDCVAIGLSTEGFDVSDKMPGWDTNSYGYHGDDGGIFHSNGDMLRSFGPRFGVGDTVGCGIDYVNQGIFFTLNGEFLGYAWTGIDLTKKFYPTVGVDTNCPVEFNFGSSPFAFDLQPFLDQHEPLIKDAISSHYSASHRLFALG